MKKIVALVAVLFSVVAPVQSQAADTKALVIIDSYFDSRVSGQNVSCIVLATKSPCTDVVKSFPKSLTDNINHGDAMVEVAKKQSTSLSIIALRSGASPSADVNAGNLIDALKWVDANSSNIGAVSISRKMNPTSSCAPSSTNTAPYGGVAKADAEIRRLVSVLKGKNVLVFASTGNIYGSTVNYPACILDTVSVGTGGINKAGQVVSTNTFDSNTDYFVSEPFYLYKSPVLGDIAQATSPATVAVAASFVSGKVFTTKVVNVLP